jgi:type II secretory ATPase GspE/PulE/Tfp pilus assembly ATPase PilB-like protein
VALSTESRSLQSGNGVRQAIRPVYVREEQHADELFAVERGDAPPAIRAVDELHTAAIAAGASDIHIEPAQGGGRVRLRVDGILHESTRIPRELFSHVVSRVKLLAAMDIADRRQPQDGRYHIDAHGRSIDARVSSMPTINGEKLVIRLLDMHARVPTLEDLGMPSLLLEQYRRLVHAPHGFIVVCGPTGSGKTTTLYASLSERNVEGQHLCTIEDPVEIRMTGVAQVQVNTRAGLTFAGALRAFWRQDPNVIMVGEPARERRAVGRGASRRTRAAASGNCLGSLRYFSATPRAATMFEVPPSEQSRSAVGRDLRSRAAYAAVRSARLRGMRR